MCKCGVARGDKSAQSSLINQSGSRNLVKYTYFEYILVRNMTENFISHSYSTSFLLYYYAYFLGVSLLKNTLSTSCFYIIIHIIFYTPTSIMLFYAFTHILKFGIISLILKMDRWVCFFSVFRMCRTKEEIVALKAIEDFLWNVIYM